MVLRVPESLRHTLRALRHRNYRRFYVGQGASLVGSWMQRVALSWLAYRLTGSETVLGLLVFLNQAPTAFLASVAGVLADRLPKKRLLIWAQAGEMVMAFALAILVLLDQAEVWKLLIISFVSGLVSAFETPIRQSFIVEMLDDRADLPGALALNSTLFNGARLVGPAIAGIIVAKLGEGWCFALNGFSYLAVIAALITIVPRNVAVKRPEGRFFETWREGMAYCWETPAVRLVLGLVTLVSLFALPYLALMPAFAKVVLGGDAQTFGFLTSSIGVGALGGGLALAMRRGQSGLLKLIRGAMAMFGGALCLVAMSSQFYLSSALLIVTGFSMMLMFASMNTFLQTTVPDHLRGRVISLYVVCFVGIGPFGSLAAGWVATLIGTPWTIGLGGLTALGLAMGFWKQMGRLDR